MRRSSAGNAGHAQRHIFRDRVILAIAGAPVKRHQRRAPDVELAELGEVVGCADRKVDGAIDLADAGAAFALSAAVDDLEKLQRGIRSAMLTVAVAQGELDPFVFEPARDPAAIWQQAAANTGEAETERLGGLGSLRPARECRAAPARRPVRSKQAASEQAARPRARGRKTPSDAPCPGIGEARCAPRACPDRFAGDHRRGGFSSP